MPADKLDKMAEHQINETFDQAVFKGIRLTGTDAVLVFECQGAHSGETHELHFYADEQFLGVHQSQRRFT